MNNPSEHIKFIDSDNKPYIKTIRQYFNTRLEATGQPGVIIFHDFLGNTVVTSPGHAEHTLAGRILTSLVASPEGIHLIAANPGILSQIYNGTVAHQNHVWGGLESHIYKIPLKTNAGIKEFALKYTFPVNSFNRCFTSGIIAMHLMQLAQKEPPIPDINYAVPIFATHDITLTPFIHNGISTNNLIDYLFFPGNEVKLTYFLNKHELSANQKKILLDMSKREYDTQQNKRLSFIHYVDATMESQRRTLKDWVYTACCKYPEFRQHQYHTNDTTLLQSVIDLEKIYKLSQMFYENPQLHSTDPKFVRSLLSTISLVELGIGNIAD